LANHNEVSLLRLSSARRRIDAFLDQIDDLATSSFPHNDGKKALEIIRLQFVGMRGRLDMPVGAAEALIDQTCLHVADQVSDYTEVLGFILRSTNVRNPFELHFALKKLIEHAIGPDAKLLISSEWAFLPFTYPMSIEMLPDFVLIGSPAPESGNVLIAPLAGHEIGHSAWRRYGLFNEYSAIVAQTVADELAAHPKIEEALLHQEQLEALGARIIRDRCGKHAIHQLEEVFCDLFGLYLFGASYIFAYDYLLAPGGYDRNLGYPSDARRMDILREAALKIGIKIDDTVTRRWNVASCRAEARNTASIVDAVAERIVPTMRYDLFARLSKLHVLLPDDKTVSAVQSAFERGEPYAKSASLAEIISAGWLYLRKKGGMAADNQREQYKVLGDLMLKSIEVAEYLERSASDA